MTKPTLILHGGQTRGLAHRWIEGAPHGTIVTFGKPGRTLPQNARMWATLTEIARQVEHAGMKHSPELWKSLFMHGLGHEAQIMEGLNGEPFPVGFSSSKLSKEQMSDLIEYMNAFCAERGVKLQEEVA